MMDDTPWQQWRGKPTEQWPVEVLRAAVDDLQGDNAQLQDNIFRMLTDGRLREHAKEQVRHLLDYDEGKARPNEIKAQRGRYEEQLREARGDMRRVVTVLRRMFDLANWAQECAPEELADGFADVPKQLDAAASLLREFRVYDMGDSD